MANHEESENNDRDYWLNRFNKLIGDKPLSLYELPIEKLKALVLELESEFKSPDDIIRISPDAFDDDDWIHNIKLHPSLQRYLEIMKKHIL